MSITAETAQAHKNDPAVLCCRAEEGTELTPANFEDPAIFPDLIDTGLITEVIPAKNSEVKNANAKKFPSKSSLANNIGSEIKASPIFSVGVILI